MTALMPEASALAAAGFGVSACASIGVGLASARSGLRTAEAAARPASSRSPRRVRWRAEFFSRESFGASCMRGLQRKFRETNVARKLKSLAISAIEQSVQRARQFGLGLEADSGNFRQRDVAVLHGNIVGESAEGLKDSGIRFVAAESQARGDVQGHLVAAVRNAALRRPAVLFEHFENAQIFDKAVAERAIELQN